MKTIGLIGGMSWESTAEYYRLINQGVRDRVSPSASAKCLIWSFNFAEIEALQHRGAWDTLKDDMVDAARRLEAVGADMLLICTNTMHLMADEVQAEVGIPLIHIADVTGAAIQAAGLAQVGLLGTAFTMEKPFFKNRLKEKFGIEVITPNNADREHVHRIIYEELIAGKIVPQSREIYQRVIARLAEDGADGIILGCTEIPLLIRESDGAVPFFDTTKLHAMAAVDACLA